MDGIGSRSARTNTAGLPKERYSAAKPLSTSSTLIEAGSQSGLDSKLLAKVETLEQQLAKRASPEETFPTRFEPREKFLLRFLKSCQGDVEEATNVILDHIRWRKENKVDEIVSQTLEELFGKDVDPREVVNCMPIIERGEDLEKRPVLYMLASKLDARAAHRFVSPEKVFQYQVWVRERALARLDLYGKGAWRYPPYYTFVTDLRGVKLSQATGEFYSLMKRIMDLDQYHYPGRVGTLVIVNVPFFFQMIWGALRGWLGSSTEKKIMICYRESEAKKVLMSMIPQSKLPHDLGGAALSLPSVRTGTAEDFFCSQVHFSKLASISNETTSKTPKMATATKLPLVESKDGSLSQRHEQQVNTSGTADAGDETDVIEGATFQQSTTTVALDVIIRDSLERAAKRSSIDVDSSVLDKPQSRLHLIETFKARLERGENLEDLKNEVAKAISQVEHETNQFERDILMVRDRLRRRLQRMRAVGVGIQEAPGADVELPDSAAALRKMLEIVEEERDAHARAVAFARNYIDVEAQEWAQTQRSLRARLERVQDEHCGLVRTVQVALGQDALNATLRSVRSGQQKHPTL